MKRLEDAEADNDPILAVVLGAYTNHSAEAVSITRPHAGAQEYIFSKLLSESGVQPEEVSYVEMHGTGKRALCQPLQEREVLTGTGTQAGDAAEMTSVLSTLAPDHRRLPHQSLHLGSAKANVGHGESASGVTALIKVLLMMDKSTIPPHCGIKGSINHKFPTDLAQRNVHIARHPTRWARPDDAKGKRRVFVNNFSAAGGNSAVLLEDVPAQPSGELAGRDPRPAHVIATSAKSISALKRNLENLASFVTAGAVDPNFLPRLSYTTTARRMHHPFRFSTVAGDPAELRVALSSAAGRADFKRTRAAPPAVAFVFSGQGGHYLAMGRDLYEHNTVFRSDVLGYNQICVSQGYDSILPVFLGIEAAKSLTPMVVQLATTCLQMALASLWKSLGIQPDMVLGHSLGHYAALKVAGVLSAADAIYLVGSRAQLLQEKCVEGSHSMLAAKATLLQIKPLLGPEHEIACVNGPKEIVISGAAKDVESLAGRLDAHHIKATRLDVPFAFHSSQVDPILAELEKIASGVRFRSNGLPIISALLAEVLHAGEGQAIGPEYLRRHCRETVNFRDALDAARSEGLIQDNTIWIEIGPHTHCSSFLKSSLGCETFTVPSMRRNEDGWKVLADSLSKLYQAGLDIDWNEYHRDFKGSHRVLPLPAYAWDNKKYWIQYEHNWTLTKGDAPKDLPANTSLDSTSELSTASVQKIIQESKDGSTINIVAQSDLSSAELSEVVKGHKVNGADLCTSVSLIPTMIFDSLTKI